MRWFLGIISFFLVLFLAIIYITRNQSPHYVKVAERLREEVALELQRKEGFECIGIGGGMYKEVQKLSLIFSSPRYIQIDAARKLLIECCEHFLNKINQTILSL